MTEQKDRILVITGPHDDMAQTESEISDKSLEAMSLRLQARPYITPDELFQECLSLEQHPHTCGCQQSSTPRAQSRRQSLRPMYLLTSVPTSSESVPQKRRKRRSRPLSADKFEDLDLRDSPQTRERGSLLEKKSDVKPSTTCCCCCGPRKRPSSFRWISFDDVLPTTPPAEESTNTTTTGEESTSESLQTTLEETYKEGRMSETAQKHLKYTGSRDLCYLGVVMGIAMVIIIGYVFISESHRKPDQPIWNPTSVIYSNVLAYFLQHVPATFTVQFQINNTDTGESYVGRLAVDTQKSTYAYDYSYAVMIGDVLARDTYDGTDRVLSYYKHYGNDSFAYQPISWQQVKPLILPPWNQILQLPIVSTDTENSQSICATGPYAFMRIFGRVYDLCMFTPFALGPNYISADNTRIVLRSLTRGLHPITIPVAPSLPYNSGSFPRQPPPTSKDLASYLQLQAWYVQHKARLPDFSWTNWYVLDRLEPVSRDTVDQSVTFTTESPDNSNNSSAWWVSKSSPVPLTHGATCVFIPGLGSLGNTNAATSTIEYAFGMPAQMPYFATPGKSYYAPDLTSQMASDTTWNVCAFYEGQSFSFKQWVGPPASGYYVYNQTSGAFIPCNSTQFTSVYRYGCQQTWTLNLPTVALAPNHPTLVSAVCQLVNRLWDEQTAQQPVAIFSHSTGALTLLEGLRSGQCISELRWFAMAPTFLGSTFDSWVYLMCQALGTYDAFPIPGAAGLLEKWLGDCAHISLKLTAISKLSYPLLRTIEDRQLIQKHVIGAACGTNGRGLSQQHDFMSSALLNTYDRLGWAQDAVRKRASDLGWCDGFRQPTCDSWPVITDGFASLDSCQFGHENQTWSHCFADAFYTGSMNHFDLACRARDSFTQPDQMPCAWIFSRIRSLFVSETNVSKQCSIL